MAAITSAESSGWARGPLASERREVGKAELELDGAALQVGGGKLTRNAVAEAGDELLQHFGTAGIFGEGRFSADRLGLT